MRVCTVFHQTYIFCIIQFYTISYKKKEKQIPPESTPLISLQYQRPFFQAETINWKNDPELD